jgi:hypothetical protein
MSIPHCYLAVPAVSGGATVKAIPHAFRPSGVISFWQSQALVSKDC